MNPKLKYLLTSRKFWAALIGLFLVILKAFKPDFSLSDTETANIVYVLIAYILGTAIEDARATSTITPPILGPPSVDQAPSIVTTHLRVDETSK